MMKFYVYGNNFDTKFFCVYLSPSLCVNSKKTTSLIVSCLHFDT